MSNYLYCDVLKQGSNEKKSKRRHSFVLVKYEEDNGWIEDFNK